MKKFIKSLAMVCLALVLVCPLALVGCDKNYTISIQIVNSNSNSGSVYLKDVNGTSVVGDSAVSSGDKFEYFVKPVEGYEISKVVVDGEEQTGYNVNGAYFYLDNVSKNHSVKVTFKLKEFTVSFYCMSSGGSYELFKTEVVSYSGSINLNQATYGGEMALWYYKDGNDNVYLYNDSTDPEVSKDNIVPGNVEGKESNMLFVYADTSVYCNLTADQLIEMGVVR